MDKFLAQVAKILTPVAQKSPEGAGFVSGEYLKGWAGKWVGSRVCWCWTDGPGRPVCSHARGIPTHARTGPQAVPMAPCAGYVMTPTGGR